MGSCSISSSIAFNSAVRLVSLRLSLSLVAQTLSVCLISIASDQMGDRGKANLCAVGSEEDVFVDKKYVNRQFYISMELD